MKVPPAVITLLIGNEGAATRLPEYVKKVSSVSFKR